MLSWVLADTGPGAGAAGTNAVTSTVVEAVADPARFASTLWTLLQDWGLRVVAVVVVLSLAWLIAGSVRKSLRRQADKTQLDATLIRFTSNIAKWVILALATVASLGILNIPTAGFTAVLGAAGLAIALGFQNSLSNLAGGVMLLVFRPFKVGDTIRSGPEIGRVNDIDLLVTELDTVDGRRLVVPNAQLFGGMIENITHHPNRRAAITFGVAYSADIDTTRAVLESAVARIPGALASPAPDVGLLDLGPASVQWTVGVWTLHRNFGDVRQALIRETKLALESAGIGFALTPTSTFPAKQ
jgi:small conductance mechanosensitive channel